MEYSLMKNTIIVIWLQNENETKNEKQKSHKLRKKSTYVHLGEIFATNVQTSAELTMHMEEYQSLCAGFY